MPQATDRGTHAVGITKDKRRAGLPVGLTMVGQKDRVMGRDQSDARYEWVNAWAASAMAEALALTKDETTPTPKPDPAQAPSPAAAPFPAFPPDQLMRDIAEIERARDAID